MTKKELEELVKKQSEQISELISLVQNQKKETIIVKESPSNIPSSPYQPAFPTPWTAPPTSPTPTYPFNPFITWCDTSPEKHTLTAPLPDDFKDKPFNDFGDGKFKNQEGMV